MSDPNVNRTHSLRPFTDDDLAAAQRLSSAFDWPHRIEDWRFVARVGSGFVAEDASGVIGTALSWKYGDAHASLGMVIVAPEQHGRGIGRAHPSSRRMAAARRAFSLRCRRARRSSTSGAVRN